MNSLVYDQISTLGKTFVANVAFEWFFTSMHSFVLLQIALLCEAFAAITAREWFFAIVRVNVNIQRALLHVVLVTIGIRTGEQFPFRVMLHVLRQRGGPFESFATNRAEVRLSDYVSQLTSVLAVVFRQVGAFRK